MFPQQNPAPQRDQRSILTRSVEQAITLAAAAVSLFGGMALYDLTHPAIQALAIKVYGSGSLADAIGTLAWGAICFGLCFFIARASLFALWVVIAAVGIRYGASLAF